MGVAGGMLKEWLGRGKVAALRGCSSTSAALPSAGLRERPWGHPAVGGSGQSV